MNKLDVAGLLTTYSIKCVNARDKEHLKELVRELKRELNSLCVIGKENEYGKNIIRTKNQK